MKELVQGDERDDDQFFLDTLFIGNIEKAGEWHAVIKCTCEGEIRHGSSQLAD